MLDFSWVWAGPYCALQLAHLGADVIRVESSRRPCMYRNTLPMADDIQDINRAGGFNQWNQGKRSIALDLTKPEAVEITRQLVRHCDVVVENFAAGSIARMGLGYETLKQFRPDLVMLSMSGYGQTGPYSTHLSFGALIEAASGFTLLNGYPGMRTRASGLAYPDPTSGIFGAMAVVAALIHRARTGEGQHIDLAMLEAVLSLMPEALLEYAITGRLPQPMGNHDQWMAPHNCYKALGNEHMWVTIVVGSEQEWRALCQAIGQPALAEDPRFRMPSCARKTRAELDGIIETWTASRDRWEITGDASGCGGGGVSQPRRQRPGRGPAHERPQIPGPLASSGGRNPHPRRHRLEDVGNSLPRPQDRSGAGRRYRFHSEFDVGLFGPGDRALAQPNDVLV